jgi:hypothetical protein
LLAPLGPGVPAPADLGPAPLQAGPPWARCCSLPVAPSPFSVRMALPRFSWLGHGTSCYPLCPAALHRPAALLTDVLDLVLSLHLVAWSLETEHTCAAWARSSRLETRALLGYPREPAAAQAGWRPCSGSAHPRVACCWRCACSLLLDPLQRACLPASEQRRRLPEPRPAQGASLVGAPASLRWPAACCACI